MKPGRIFRLALLAATMLVALTGSASATPLYTSPSGTEFTGAIHETSTGSWTMKAGVEASCSGATRVWDIDTNETNHAAGEVTSFSFSGCAGTVDVLSKGSLSVGENGALSGSGQQITITQLGISCVYGTGTGTSLGTVVAGSPAEVLESATLPKQSGGAFCATSGSVAARYKITSPNPLLEDH